MSSEENTFEGGLESLGEVKDSIDAHQAVGRWWAKAILRPSFDNGEEDMVNIIASLEAARTSAAGRSEVEEKIGGFAEALAHISRQRKLDSIAVSYDPGSVLQEAATLAGMPVNGVSTFPWISSTDIREGKVLAHMGCGQPVEQIWPPQERA